MLYIPLIAKSDFDAVKENMNPYLNHTYDTWVELCADWRTEWGSKGTVDIKIDPVKFDFFARESCRAPNIKCLLDFADHLGKRRTH